MAMNKKLLGLIILFLADPALAVTTTKAPAVTTTAAAFDCATLPSAAQPTCTAAKKVGLDVLPLADGVTGLNRALTVTVTTANEQTVNNPCGKCLSYKLPSGSFTFGISETFSDTAITRGNGFTAATVPVATFDCDTKDDKYALLMWDAFGDAMRSAQMKAMMGNKGVLHGMWVNIPCTADNKGNLAGANTLAPFAPPINPSATPNAYGFYLFKQTGDIVLNQDKLAGFDPTAFRATAMTLMTGGAGLAIQDVLKPLKDSGKLSANAPVARAWAKLVSSPFSAFGMNTAFKSEMGQCAATSQALASWASTKVTPDPTCSTTTATTVTTNAPTVTTAGAGGVATTVEKVTVPDVTTKGSETTAKKMTTTTARQTSAGSIAIVSATVLFAVATTTLVC